MKMICTIKALVLIIPMASEGISRFYRTKYTPLKISSYSLSTILITFQKEYRLMRMVNPVRSITTENFSNLLKA